MKLTAAERAARRVLLEKKDKTVMGRVLLEQKDSE